MKNKGIVNTSKNLENEKTKELSIELIKRVTTSKNGFIEIYFSITLKNLFDKIKPKVKIC